MPFGFCSPQLSHGIKVQLILVIFRVMVSESRERGIGKGTKFHIGFDQPWIKKMQLGLQGLGLF